MREIKDRSAERRIRVADLGSAAAATAAAARDLAAALAAGRAGDPATLLVSGGSALGILRRCCAAPETLPADLSHLEVGLVDERWGKPGHAGSNGRAVRETGFAELLEARGGRFREVLGQAEDAVGSARVYESWLAGRLGRSRVLATVGVGGDGHTFGVLPQQDEATFARLFPARRLFVAYEHSGPAEHRRRLTLTPAAARYLGAVFGVALGAAKATVFDRLRGSRPALPAHLFPAGILWPVEGCLYTDRRRMA